MMKSEIYDIYGMTCASCQAHVSKAISKLKGVENYNVNLLTNRLLIIEAIVNVLPAPVPNTNVPNLCLNARLTQSF